MDIQPDVTGEGQGVIWVVVSMATRGSCRLGLFHLSVAALLGLGLFVLSLGIAVQPQPGRLLLVPSVTGLGLGLSSGSICWIVVMEA